MANDLSSAAPFLSDTDLVELLWKLSAQGNETACAIIHAEMDSRFADY